MRHRGPSAGTAAKPPPLPSRVLIVPDESRRLEGPESSLDKAQISRTRFPGEESRRGLNRRNRLACTLADDSPSRTGTLPRLCGGNRSLEILCRDSPDRRNGGLPTGCPVAEERRQFGVESFTSRRQVCVGARRRKVWNLNGKGADSGCRAGDGARRRFGVVGRAPGGGGA